MLRFLVLIAVLFGVAFGLHRLRALSGEVVVTLGDTAYALDLTTAVIALIVTILIVAGLGWFVREVVRSPGRFMRGWRRRNEDRGRQAISDGLLAVAAGDLRAADRAAMEAERRTPNLPLALLLKAQAAQLKGDRFAARAAFHDMADHPATRIAGLRGLHIEAEREGEREAARQLAERARTEAPSAPWASRALLRHQSAEADWDGALQTLTGATEARILDKRTARRLRAVLLTAKARDSEDGAPDAARQAALEAHELAPDLAPAAVIAGRLLARQGDIRRATRVLETAWKAATHPDIADAYLHVRAGDAAGDRLKRAETLLRMRNHDDARHAIARAAVDARDFQRAREALRQILTERPTRRALILMSELEEAESGDSGRARGWLARAVHAPRDPVWIADGMVLDDWAPASPVTGRLDAVEWKVPPTESEPPKMVIDARDLAPPAAPLLTADPAVLRHAGPPPTISEDKEPGRPADAAMPASVDGERRGAAGSPAPAPERHAGTKAKPSVAPGAPGSHMPPVVETRPPVPDDPGVSSDEEDDMLRRLRAV